MKRKLEAEYESLVEGRVAAKGIMVSESARPPLRLIIGHGIEILDVENALTNREVQALVRDSLEALSAHLLRQCESTGSHELEAQHVFRAASTLKRLWPFL